MIFRQLLEPVSSSYTYLVGCEDTGHAVLIDPVISTIDRDLAELTKLGLKLLFSLETHIHADHITAALELKKQTGCRIAGPAVDRLPCTDIGVEEGLPFIVGSMQFTPLHTPGHTDGHFAYLLGDRLFSGDALLIDGCGRTDFQNGNADDLFHSVREKLFALLGDTLVYPGHDYQGRRVSTIAQEKQRNPRLGEAITLERFRVIMRELNLPYPRFIDHAVPGNRRCGACSPDLTDDLCCYAEQSQRDPET